MKKLIAISIAVLMVLGFSVLANAEDDPMEEEKTITVNLTVSGNAFGFQIWPEDNPSNMGDVTLGASGFGDIHFYCTSNYGTQWMINASSVGVSGAAFSEILPVWFATFDGLPADSTDPRPTGTFSDPAIELTGASQPVYIAADSEYNVVGLQVAGLIVVKTTLATKPDIYDGMVLLTMTH